MAKSRSFSIFLLKEGYDANNSLDPDHGLEELKGNVSKLPENGSLFIMDSAPSPPWWRDYWGIDQELKQTLKGAIIFLPVDKRCFAITFGHTYHKLKGDCYEYDFGLRTTLNAVDKNELKSTDILQLENAKRSRIQAPTAADITFFDFNKDDSIVKRLTGKVNAEYKSFFTNVTGASNLKITSKNHAGEIATLCAKLFELYEKEDYKESFPDIQNIVPVKDPILINELNDKLAMSFKDGSTELMLTIPDIIDYKDSFQIKYIGAGSHDSLYDGVCITHYRQYLVSNDVTEVTVAILRSHKLNIQTEDGSSKYPFSIFKCLLFDCELNSLHYHLCDGEWYRIEKDYIEKVRNDLDPFFLSNNFLPDCSEAHEGDYNEKVSKGNSALVCLDRTNIAPIGQRQVEPCDLIYTDNGRVYLAHIKISTRSSCLSHLFNQGLNSIELLRTTEESKNKLKSLTKNKFDELMDQDNYSVVYGIITHKDKEKKSESLPIFSRISLLRSIRSLKLMGVPVSVVLIKNTFDRKNKSSHE